MSNHICPYCGSSDTEEDPVVFCSDSFVGITPTDYDPFSIMVDVVANSTKAVRKVYEVVSGKQRYYCNKCKKNFYVDEDDE